MSLGIFMPAISKNVGAKSMFKTMSFILEKKKTKLINFVYKTDGQRMGKVKE